MKVVEEVRCIHNGIPSGCGGYDTVVVVVAGAGACVVVVTRGAVVEGGTAIAVVEVAGKLTLVDGNANTVVVTIEVEDATVVDAVMVELVDGVELVVEVPSEELDDEQAPRTRAAESSRTGALFLCRMPS